MTGTNPTCPLCGDSRHRFAFSERGFDLVQCDACELFYIVPFPMAHDQYKTVANYDYDELAIVSPSRHYASSQHFCDEFLPVIRQHLVGARAVLDVGCGTGYLLERLGQLDPRLIRVGLELNASRAAYAQTKANCEIRQEPVESYQTATRFDAILLMNVLSHVPSFDALFNSLYSLLSDGGVVLLKVGEMTSQVKRSAVYDWAIPDHIHFLGMTTIQHICDKYGFQIVYHERRPVSKDIFSAYKFRSQGRSRLRNALKRSILAVPFALRLLARAYDAVHGKAFYSSFVAIGKQPSRPAMHGASPNS